MAQRKRWQGNDKDAGGARGRGSGTKPDGLHIDAKRAVNALSASGSGDKGLNSQAPHDVQTQSRRLFLRRAIILAATNCPGNVDIWNFLWQKHIESDINVGAIYFWGKELGFHRQPAVPDQRKLQPPVIDPPAQGPRGRRVRGRRSGADSINTITACSFIAELTRQPAIR